MRKTLKLTASAALALVVLVGWSFRSAVAQTAAKGKITVTVKTADGTAAAGMPVSLLAGNVPMPAFGGRRGGGGGGGAPPASQPTPLMTGTTDDKGVYTFENVDAGDYTVFAGNMGRGGRRGGAGGAGGPPTTGPAAGGQGGGRGFGRGSATGTVKAGDELKLDISLMAGRGGRGGGRRGGGGGGGAGAGGGQGA